MLLALALAEYPAFTAAAELSGSGALSAGALVTQPAAATLSGSGSLAAAGLVQFAASAALSGSGSLAAAALVTQPAAAALAGTGSLAAGALLALAAGAPLSGTGVLAVSVQVIAPVTEPPVLWSAQPAALRWRASPLPPRWIASPSALRWRIVMAVFPPIAAVSLECVNVTWLSDLDGTTVDPTGQTTGQPELPVQFAFPQTSGNYAEPAQPVVWFTGSWLLGGTGRGFVAQCLVGPGGVVTLTAGLAYDCWSKVSGMPESPAKFAGIIEVY